MMIDIFLLNFFFFGGLFYYFHIYRPPRRPHNFEELELVTQQICDFYGYELLIGTDQGEEPILDNAAYLIIIHPDIKDAVKDRINGVASEEDNT